VLFSGFVGQDCDVLCGPNLDALTHVDVIYPEDSNDRQEFDISSKSGSLDDTRCMQLIFPSSTDFYGRVTVYSLEVFNICIVNELNECIDCCCVQVFGVDSDS
jgi:hypothetical protein